MTNSSKKDSSHNIDLNTSLNISVSTLNESNYDANDIKLFLKRKN